MSSSQNQPEEVVVIVETNPRGGAFSDIASYFMEQMMEEIVLEQELMEMADDIQLLEALTHVLQQEEARRAEIQAIAAVHDKSNVNKEILEYAAHKASHPENDAKLLRALVHTMETEKAARVEARHAKTTATSSDEASNAAHAHPHLPGGRSVSHTYVPEKDGSKLMKNLHHLVQVEAKNQNADIEAIAAVHDKSNAKHNFEVLYTTEPSLHHDDSKLLKALHHLVEISAKDIAAKQQAKK